MIHELNSLTQFDNALKGGAKNIFPDYKEFSTPSIGIYDPDSAIPKIRSAFGASLHREGILPYYKIFVHSESEDIEDAEKYNCVHVWQAYSEIMTNENVFSEILWQSKGMNVSSIKQGKAMLSLLKHAEQHARRNSFHSLILSRDPNLHMINKEGDPLNIKNYFTRSGYDPCVIKYVKKLK